MTTVKEFVRNSEYSPKLVSVQKRIKFAQRVKSDLLYVFLKNVCYIEVRFWFALIDPNLTAQTTGSHSCAGGGIQIPETLLQALSPFFPPSHPQHERAYLQVIGLGDGATFGSGVSVRSWQSYGKIEDCKQSIRTEIDEVT